MKTNSKEKGVERFDIINGFVLENADKLQRVLDGEPARSGESGGGLLAKYGELENIPKEEVLAHYDKLGGYITKGVGGDSRVKVKNGSFWDIKKKQPRGEKKVTKDKDGNEKTTFEYVPELMYIFNVGGEFVEVNDPAKLAQAITGIENTLAAAREKSDAKKARARAKSLTK